MTKFSGLVLSATFFSLFIICVIENTPFVNSAGLYSNLLSPSKISVDKLLLIIRSIRERLPLKVDDVIEAYNQYSELHKAQSALTNQYKTSPESKTNLQESSDNDGSSSGDLASDTNRQYDEIASILDMKELRIICWNLFNIIGDYNQRAKIRGKHHTKLVLELERAINSLQ